MPPCPYNNDPSLLPPMVPSTSRPSPLSTLVRITQHAAPDLSYSIHIYPISAGSSEANSPSTTHTLAQEADMIDFPTSTFSFSSFGPLTAFLSTHPTSTALITKVQWEAHTRFDVAAGSTLTVAKMLVNTLPALEEVVIRLVMSRKEATKPYVQANKDEWVEGLRGLKKGLKVSVLKLNPSAFERGFEGGSVRCVQRVSKGKKDMRDWDESRELRT